MSWNYPNKKSNHMPSSDTSEPISNIKTQEEIDNVVKIYLTEPRNLSVEEAKLATDRLAKQQLSVAAASEKIISKLEGFFLIQSLTIIR